MIRFSRREKEVIRCLFAAMSNPEIAKELGICERTVKQYIHRVGMRLGCSYDPRFILRVRIVYLLVEMRHEIAVDSLRNADLYNRWQEKV